jgi:hypothetical protein
VTNLLRSFVTVLSVGLLAGCATVSVVASEASIEAPLTAGQTELRRTANAYCDEVVEAGWAEEGTGLSGLVGRLMHGRRAGDTPPAYAERIGASENAPALVLARIASDTQSARMGLEQVTAQAAALLADPDTGAAGRADVTSYERALVRAQSAYRNFGEAMAHVLARADLDTAPVEAELDLFWDTIEQSRRTADHLAARYSGDLPPGS